MLAQRVARGREKLGISQRELARRAGLSSRHVSMIERGAITNIRASTASALADALGIAPGELLFGAKK